MNNFWIFHVFGNFYAKYFRLRRRILCESGLYTIKKELALQNKKRTYANSSRLFSDSSLCKNIKS
jgi:hypothetical protein